MSERPTAQERAAAIAAQAKTQPSVDERRLAAMLDRNITRHDYRVPGLSLVHFNPPVTLGEARSRYPTAEVLP